MVQAVDTVSALDHLDLLQLAQGGWDCHVVRLPLVLQDRRLQAGVDLVADDQRHELDEYLRRRGLVRTDTHGAVSKIGLVAPEELLGAVPALVQRERLAGGHLLRCHDAEVSAEPELPLHDLAFLPGDKQPLSV